MHFEQLNLDPKVLLPNPWNTNVVPPENEAKLENSIKRFGMFKPVIVRQLPNGSHQILGGQHRAAIAARLGLATIPVMNLGVIPDDRAKEIGLVDNGRFGQDDTLRLADLLKDLPSADELSSFMPVTDEDLSAIFAATSIELDDLDLPDEEELPATLPTTKAAQTHQIMRFKVPVDDVDAVTQLIESVMKVQGFNTSDSLTNAGDALVHIVKEHQQ